MKEFFDTSVLVAAFWNGHVHHPSSIKRFAAARREHSACGLHSVAEVYAVMTALPVRPLIPPEQVLLFLEDIRERLALISLSADESIAAIQHCAVRGFLSGRVYDALLLTCAARWKAETIYTWNLRHYQSLAPELADKIQNP